MEDIRFIHAADLHLDSPFTGLKHIPEHLLQVMKEATFTAFQQIVNEAIYRQVDFLLLAGDLYDGANRNLRTQVRFRKEMERLNQHHIPVYIIHGNHDHLGGKWVSLQQPENVTVFSDVCEMKVFQKNDTVVHIYGYSYPTQHVTQRVIENYQKQDGADYHIGMLHGNLEGQTEHSAYAPFSLDELIEKDFDYWALGHIHKRQELASSPPIIYPGNIQGRHKKESGIKGCYEVSLSGKHADLRFIPTSSIIWETVFITFDEQDDFDALLSKCRNALQQLREYQMCYFVSLQITNHHPILRSEQFDADLLEILQQEEELQEVFVYPYQMKVNTDVHTFDEHQPLLAFIQQAGWTELDVNEAIQPMFKHPLGRKFLSALTAEEKAELLQEAEQYVCELLARGGSE
ncbi:MAG: exonuclease SbcCD subunit D [Bacillus sp. (in: firmicutes)]